jgi:hypothetical protein
MAPEFSKSLQDLLPSVQKLIEWGRFRRDSDGDLVVCTGKQCMACKKAVVGPGEYVFTINI